MVTKWIACPPATVVVYVLRRTPITPNQVTFLSTVVAAGAEGKGKGKLSVYVLLGPKEDPARVSLAEIAAG